MPPTPDPKPTSVRIPPEMLARLDRLADALHPDRLSPALRPSRHAVLLAALTAGLDALETRHGLAGKGRAKGRRG